MAASVKRKPPDLLEEHIASRKSWGEYVRMASELRRATSSQVDDFLRDLRARVETAMQRR